MISSVGQRQPTSMDVWEQLRNNSGAEDGRHETPGPLFNGENNRYHTLVARIGKGVKSSQEALLGPAGPRMVRRPADASASRIKASQQRFVQLGSG